MSHPAAVVVSTPRLRASDVVKTLRIPPKEVRIAEDLVETILGAAQAARTANGVGKRQGGGKPRRPAAAAPVPAATAKPSPGRPKGSKNELTDGKSGHSRVAREAKSPL